MPAAGVKLCDGTKDDGRIINFYLRNELLDTIPEQNLKNLLNEKSILLRVPQEGLIISDTSGVNK